MFPPPLRRVPRNDFPVPLLRRGDRAGLFKPDNKIIMAKYRPFYCEFWTDPDIEQFSAEEKLVYAFLFTNSRTTESGIYSVSPKNISDCTNLTTNKINIILNTLQNTYHKITYDNNIIFIHGFLRRNFKGNPGLLEKSILSNVKEFPSEICWQHFLNIYKFHSICNKIKTILDTWQSVSDTSIAMTMNMTMNNEDELIKEGVSEEVKEKVIIPDYLKESIKEFIEHRRKNRRVMTEKAIELSIKKVQKLYPGNNDKQIAAIYYAIERGWQGIFKMEEEDVSARGQGKTGFRKDSGKNNSQRPGYDEGGNAIGAAAKQGEFAEGVITLDGVPDHR